MTGYQTPTRDEHDWMLGKIRKALEHHVEKALTTAEQLELAVNQ